jgi:DNA-binding MarR family transcriptional regulator
MKPASAAPAASAPRNGSRNGTSVLRNGNDNGSAGPPQDLDLDEVLSFMRALWQLHHGLQLRSKKMERSLGLTRRQRLVLRMLGRFKQMRSGDLARLLEIHPSTLTCVLRSLEGRKLVRRQTEPGDRRRVLLSLTAEGQLLDVPTETTVEAATSRALKRLRPAQIDDARMVMRALSVALRPEE